MKEILRNKIERNKEYKRVRNLLLNEREERLKRYGDYFYEPRRVNFCKLISYRYDPDLNNYPELMSRKPEQEWKGTMFWFEPTLIEPRLEIIEEAIKETNVSFWDRILNRV